MRLGDAVSVLRIGLSAAFLLSFRAEYGALFVVSLACAVLAQISDHIDGYLIRKYAAPTLMGWVIDSFADRAFYIAALLAFQREFGLSELLVWAFTLREICLYAARVLVGDFQVILSSFRKLALIHAGFIRLGIAIECLVPFNAFSSGEKDVLSECALALFWIATAMGYYNLYVLFRAQRLFARRDTPRE